MRIARVGTALTLVSVGLAGIIVAAPPARAADGAIAPVTSCETLGKADLSAQDAVITSTATATREGHAYCDVKGYISPMTQFEALLPLETWRGDYLQQGCGGLCGHFSASACRAASRARVKSRTGTALRSPSRASIRAMNWSVSSRAEICFFTSYCASSPALR